jgi:Rps23 Pro-64 3,4-dihydroxylase Tpa1-like proline 4-hydroxylase
MAMEMLYTQDNITELNSKGFTVIDNILPLDIANKLYNTFLNESKWENINQVREEHYAHVFESSNPYLPQKEEPYLANFDRSTPLEDNKFVQKTFNDHLVPLLQNVSPFDINEYDVRCYKLDKGGHYRTHVDAYAGSINLILYLNPKWRWDWGGVLHVLSHKNIDEIHSIFPKFNRVVLLNNKVFRAPHFISTVEPFASYSRYALVSFNK